MKILFGVFDWGLGHATRDMPLIEILLEKKHSVDIISTGKALKVLKNHFGKRCKYFEVSSLYNIYNYKRFFKAKFTFSIHKIIISLKKARRGSEKIIEKGKYDKVISDCRYDVYDKVENSYLINHQLRFKAPAMTQRILEKFLGRMTKKYRYVLVPDYDKPNLTGELSHELKYIPKEKIKYLGVISHVRKRKLKENIDYFVSLSGPEETRKFLEKEILKQIVGIKGKFVIAGGNPDEKKNTFLKNVKFYSFLESKKQEEMMNRAKFLIIRAGYTTVMELVELDKNALLIPSPGQTEQEYLGDYYEKEGMFHHASQYHLKLKEDIRKAKKMKGFKPAWKTKQSVSNFYKLVFS